MNTLAKKISQKINCLSIPLGILQSNASTVQVVSSSSGTQPSSIWDRNRSGAHHASSLAMEDAPAHSQQDETPGWKVSICPKLYFLTSPRKTDSTPTARVGVEILPRSSLENGSNLQLSLLLHWKDLWYLAVCKRTWYTRDAASTGFSCF